MNGFCAEVMVFKVMDFGLQRYGFLCFRFQVSSFVISVISVRNII